MASVVGSISVPADNGAQAGPTLSFANPPISGILPGDLIYIVAAYRNAGVTLSISATGGQTWTSGSNTQSSTAVLTTRQFWCVFDGTWSGAISVTNTTGTLALTAVLAVIRPSSPNYYFDVASFFSDNLSYAAPTTPFNVNLGFVGDLVTPPYVGGMNIKYIASADDNTWGLQDGTWLNIGSAQYRNTTGSDTSISLAYMANGVNYNDSVQCTNRQLTLGGDPGNYGNLVIREYYLKPNPTIKNTAVHRASRW